MRRWQAAVAGLAAAGLSACAGGGAGGAAEQGAAEAAGPVCEVGQAHAAWAREARDLGVVLADEAGRLFWWESNPGGDALVSASPDGTERFRAPLGGLLPALAARGVVVAGPASPPNPGADALAAYDAATGAPLWRLELAEGGRPVSARLLLAGPATLAAVLDDDAHRVLALDLRTGREQARFSLAEAAEAVVADGRGSLYFQLRPGALMATDLAGQVRWSRAADEARLETVASGRLVARVGSDWLALDPATGAEAARLPAAPPGGAWLGGPGGSVAVEWDHAFGLDPATLAAHWRRQLPATRYGASLVGPALLEGGGVLAAAEVESAPNAPKANVTGLAAWSAAGEPLLSCTLPATQAEGPAGAFVANTDPVFTQGVWLRVRHYQGRARLEAYAVEGLKPATSGWAGLQGGPGRAGSPLLPASAP